MINYTPNSVCIVQLHSQEFWKYIWHLCQDMKASYLCFQFSKGWGGIHNNNNTSCIYIFFYTILQKPAYQSSLSLHFIKSNNKLIQKTLFIQRRPIAKVSRNTIQGVPSNTKHTYTDTHRQWLGHMATLHTFSPGLKRKIKRKSLIAMRSTRLSKHVSSRTNILGIFIFFFHNNTIRPTYQYLLG